VARASFWASSSAFRASGLAVRGEYPLAAWGSAAFAGDEDDELDDEAKDA